VLPVGAPNRDAAIAWLMVAGSLKVRMRSTRSRVPSRPAAMVTVSLYGEYLQSAMDDWASDNVVGSLTHGVVANDSWKSEIDTAWVCSWVPLT
jgi:glucose/mannose transport system substrate-binding protein